MSFNEDDDFGLFFCVLRRKFINFSYGLTWLFGEEKAKKDTFNFNLNSTNKRQAFIPFITVSLPLAVRISSLSLFLCEMRV